MAPQAIGNLRPLKLRVQLSQGGFEHGAMLRVRSDFELLQDSLAGKFQAFASLLFRDLFRSEQRAFLLGGGSFLLLLFDRFTLPSPGHN